MTTKQPFFVVALPRSRTAWLSTFLGYQGRRVGHDLIVRCDSIAEFDEAMTRHDGTCETGAAMGWKLIRTMWPKSKIIVVNRPIDEIVKSCAVKGLAVDRQVLEERQVMLQMLSRCAGVHSVDFDDLNSSDVCKWIFEHLLEIEFDKQWWMDLRHKNIQIDFAKRVKELYDGRERIANLVNEVLTETRKLGGERWLDLN